MAPTLLLVPFQFLHKIGRLPIPRIFIRFGFLTLPLAVAFLGFLNSTSDWFRTPFLSFTGQKHVEEYDFIVVGGGSAGCAVANRLSEHSTVLLLEAGGDPSPFVSIPSLATFLQRLDYTDYQYRTIPQNNSCLAMINRQQLTPRGKGLGGTSNLNFMVTQRGNPRDYNKMADIIGDPQWRYENLLKFFKRMEDYHGNYEFSPSSAAYHGTGGPLYIGRLNSSYMAEEFLQAGAEMGYPIRDHNSEQVPSFSNLDVTMKSGRRWSAYEAYIRPILHRPTLRISRYSKAIQIHFTPDNIAYGVTYIRHGVKLFTRARKEIILSAGAIDTPKLLMLSGIGPCGHLQQVGIPCRVNLPVGKNFQDHVTTLVGPILVNTPSSLLIDRDITAKSVKAYLFGQGPLASLSGVSAAGFIATSFAKDPLWPDIGFHMSGSGVYKSLADDFTRILGTKPGILQSYYGPHIGSDANFVLVTLLKPKVSGEVKLKSANPWAKPLINPNVFNDPGQLDIQRMVEGVKFLVNLYERTETYRRIGARLAPNSFPGCEGFQFKSDEYFECYVRSLTMTEYHLSGTCSMGRGLNDPKAVVDSHLRVLGTKGLRVADTSVFRVIPNANTNIPAIMIGEKAADLIRNEWEVSYATNYI